MSELNQNLLTYQLGILEWFTGCTNWYQLFRFRKVSRQRKWVLFTESYLIRSQSASHFVVYLYICKFSKPKISNACVSFVNPRRVNNKQRNKFGKNKTKHKLRQIEW